MPVSREWGNGLRSLRRAFKPEQHIAMNGRNDRELERSPETAQAGGFGKRVIRAYLLVD